VRYSSGFNAGEYDGRENTAICAALAASHALTVAAMWTLRWSRIRYTLRAASLHTRVQNVMRVGTSMAFVSTMKRSRPVWLIAET